MGVLSNVGDSLIHHRQVLFGDVANLSGSCIFAIIFAATWHKDTTGSRIITVFGMAWPTRTSQRVLKGERTPAANVNSAEELQSQSIQAYILAYTNLYNTDYTVLHIHPPAIHCF